MTRPADRIDDVLAELGSYWKDHPDMRLGQIVANVAGRLDVDTHQMEDTELMGALELAVVMVPTDLPYGALRSPTPDADWSTRPDPLEAIRRHRALASV